jgi:hypothetical protein
VLFHAAVPEVKDGHSVLALERSIYVISTGTDEVLCYDILENSVGNPRVVWRASDAKKDTHHVNSIAIAERDILVSAFGPKAAELWSTATNGYIHNITRDLRIKDDIYHPHSLSVRSGVIYFSDSHRNTFCTLQGERLVDLNGYTRGVTWLSDELVCLATSIGRRISKSTGLIANPADPGQLAGECSLLLADMNRREVLRSVDLSSFGPEIYDLLALRCGDIDLISLAQSSQRAEREAIRTLVHESTEAGLIPSLKAQLRDRTAEVDGLREQIQQVYTSRSWKLTRPWRALGALAYACRTWVRRLMGWLTSHVLQALPIP